MEVKIDQDKCIGCGICARICPDGIEIKDRKAFIRDKNSSCLKKAAEACPINIIDFNGDGVIENQEKENQDINVKSEDMSFGRGQGGQGRGMNRGGGQGGQGRGMNRGGGMGLGRRRRMR